MKTQTLFRSFKVLSRTPHPSGLFDDAVIELDGMYSYVRLAPTKVEKDGPRLYEVWSEGYSATGEHGTAQLMGSAHASTFAEACAKVMNTAEHKKFFNSESLTYWGCRLFDNESAARESFG